MGRPSGTTLLCREHNGPHTLSCRNSLWLARFGYSPLLHTLLRPRRYGCRGGTRWGGHRCYTSTHLLPLLRLLEGIKPDSQSSDHLRKVIHTSSQRIHN